MNPNVVSEKETEEIEKTLPKKFSEENNMDPSKVPNKLQDLTKVEEMLIVQVFSIMSIYKLYGR